MELTLTSVLALFSLLALSSAIFFASKRFNVPYTVMLVLAGLLVVPLIELPFVGQYLGFLDDMKLTPELLFYIFLPILIFESAFNINVRKIMDSAWTISLLAVAGVLISSGLIATGLYFLLPLLGLEIPFIVALLFGTIISATDPVAVLSLFKEIGAPKRLTMIFEGESLFNDGTAVAMFLVVLGIATDGFGDASTVFEGVLIFIGMVLFGVLLGLVMATLFTKALQLTKSNEFVVVTLLMISAHIIFILSEIINEHTIFGMQFYVSSIIATTVGALFLGNYSRNLLSPKTDNYLNKFIEHMAFVANSLVFLLAGLLFASLSIDFNILWKPIVLTVLIVAIVRAISVYAVLNFLNSLNIEALIPESWKKLLAWGSLRGALAIIVVLLIPEDLTISGWNQPYTPQEFILAITIGCILATLFIKAPLIKPIIRKLHVDDPEPLTLAHQNDLGMYYLRTEQSRFETHKTKGFVRDEHYKLLKNKVSLKIDETLKAREDLINKHGKKLFEQSLYLLAINAEEGVLKQLYSNEEVSERVYRKIKGKLNLQREKIEKARQDDINPALFMDGKDVFDQLAGYMVAFMSRRSTPNSQSVLEEKLQYNRAQMIMARKCLKTIKKMQTAYSEPVFLDYAYEKVTARYDGYRQKASEKVDKLLSTHGEDLAEYLSSLASKSLASSGHRALDFLQDRNILDEHDSEIIAHRWST